MRSFTFATLLLVTATHALAATSPPITEAEKFACEAVADYLSRGPIAIQGRLSSEATFNSPDRQDVFDEIEARLGPREQAVWELRTTTESFAEHGAVFHVLFPSGVEEVVTLDMTGGSGRWKIKGIRTLAETLTPRTVSKPDAHAPAAAPLSVNIFLFVYLAAALSIIGAILRTSRPRGSSLILASALVAFAVPMASLIDPAWPAHMREIANQREPVQTSRSYVSFKPLLPLRRAAAGGTPLPAIGALKGDLREIALLWKTASEIGRITPEQSKQQLASVGELSNSPLASLLRAGIAIDEGRSADAARDYALIHQVEPQHDAFWVEEQLVAPAANATSNIVTRTEHLRSRDAYLYYMRCAQRVFEGNADGARREFRDAWRIQPISRAAVISAGVFALLLRDPAISILVNLDTANEQKSADASLSRSPMTVPSETLSSASGTFVRLSIGEARLDIPGGAAIAPATTRVVSAEQFADDDGKEALGRAAHLSSHNLTSAAAQRTVEEAAQTLSEHNRWSEIVTLTEGIGPMSDGVPASLVAWRVRALLRSGHAVEARTLATGPTIARAMQRTPDSATLLELSELLAQASAWDDAIETLKKVSAIKDAPDVTGRLRQLDLRRELANSAVVTATPHFAIHSTIDVPVTVTQRVGDLLEAELQRLLRTLQLADFQPVRVNVVHWDNFREQLTGSDHILGFYDGDITIPFGGVSRFRENVVAILTHELTHAIVSQASNDNAPRWFQEGVAVRMELVEQQENIFHLRGAQRFLAVQLLDPTMQGSVDPVAVSESYVIAQTFIRFLEDRYGAESINRLIASYRAGADNDEALVALTGKPMVDLDSEFHTWGLTHAETFVDRSPWPYIQFYSLGIDPKILQGIHFSKPRP